jgi:hypothetical protein
MGVICLRINVSFPKIHEKKTGKPEKTGVRSQFPLILGKTGI